MYGEVNVILKLRKFRGCQSNDILRGVPVQKNHPVCHTPLTKQNIGYLILILFSLIFTPVAPRSSCAWLIFGMEVSRPLLQLVMKKVIIQPARGPEGPAR